MPKKKVFQFGLGWKPDIPDQRDVVLSLTQEEFMAAPPRVDLREKALVPIVNQGRLGSCTANAIGEAHRYIQMVQGNPNHFMPSRLFIYYNEREMEGTINSDAGAMIRDGMKSIADQGCPPEELWPYDDNPRAGAKFTKRPSAEAYTEAMEHQALKYERVKVDINQIRGVLGVLQQPIVIGFAVYQSFMQGDVQSTGNMEMPSRFEQMLGGHAVKLVGYDDARQIAIAQNSWSEQWGDHGYFYMPYAYLGNRNLCDDFWTLSLVEGAPAPSPTTTTTTTQAPIVNPMTTTTQPPVDPTTGLKRILVGSVPIYVPRNIPIQVEQ